MDQIYTVPEVAEWLKLDKSTVYYMVKRGEIPHLKIGKSIRILEVDLMAWIETQRKSSKQLGFKFPE